jgi:inner membrane protein
VQGLDGAQRIDAFSHGFWALDERDSGQGSRLYITDLRMGQEPAFVFRFALAQRQGDAWVPLPQVQQKRSKWALRPQPAKRWTSNCSCVLQRFLRGL